MRASGLVRPVVLLAVVLAAVIPVLLVVGVREPATVRVLLVGDSVTQGSSGDWTWRYRLWQHLTASNADVDLVGPRNDLLAPETATFGSQEYVDPHFDRDHAARWGMTLADMDHPIGDLVRRYRPDVVVELLGVNDLVWQKDSAADVTGRLRDLVTDARAADADVDVVLVALPQVWFPPVAELNAMLPGLARELDSESSRVLVAVPPELVELVDTYDAAHLAATGEVKVAAGVADALARLGIGEPAPAQWGAVRNGPRTPALLRVLPGDTTAYLSWRSPPGAHAEFVWVRDRTVDEPWIRLPWPITGGSWRSGGLLNGHVYEFRVQSAKGTAVAQDLFSNVVAVRPSPDALPPPPVLMPAPPGAPAAGGQ